MARIGGRAGGLFSYVDLEAQVPADKSFRPEGRRRRAADQRSQRQPGLPTASRGATPTHATTTDAEARLFRKGAGKEARLCFRGHLLMENRSDLLARRGYPGHRPGRARGGPQADREPAGAPPDHGRC
jgi:hypothetical protein